MLVINKKKKQEILAEKQELFFKKQINSRTEVNIDLNGLLGGLNNTMEVTEVTCPRGQLWGSGRRNLRDEVNARKKREPRTESGPLKFPQFSERQNFTKSRC